MIEKKPIEWQTQGGILEIPEGYFVYRVNLDTDPPFAIICDPNDILQVEKKVNIPKSLAYYLSTHYCGSESMRKTIEKNTRCQIRDTIKEALGL